MLLWKGENARGLSREGGGGSFLRSNICACFYFVRRLFPITVLSIYESQNSVADIETKQQAGRMVFRIPEEKWFFSAPKIKVYTGSGAQPDSYSMSIGDPF